MRKLASIQKIIDIKPIVGADRIECAVVKGWECVIAKKDEFKIGDLVCYFEVDSILPEKPEFEFLRERKFRIKTIKLKKQVSQGLIMPLSILPKGKYQEEDDITNLVGVKKHDPEADAEQKMIDQKLLLKNNRINKFLMRNKWYRSLFHKSDKKGFPEFIKKTDEERIQNIPKLIEDVSKRGLLFEFREKIDGQSATYFLLKNPNIFQFWKKYVFGVCSRNLYLEKPDNSSYWTIAKQYDIENILKKLIDNEQYVVLQGEIIGNKIQDNKYKIKGYDFYAFNLIYPQGLRRSSIVEELLKIFNINFVPLIGTQKLKSTVAENVELAKGKSKLLDIDREGLVCRNYENNISFKIINPDFLLKNE